MSRLSLNRFKRNNATDTNSNDNRWWNRLSLFEWTNPFIILKGKIFVSDLVNRIESQTCVKTHHEPCSLQNPIHCSCCRSSLCFSCLSLCHDISTYTQDINICFLISSHQSIFHYNHRIERQARQTVEHIFVYNMGGARFIIVHCYKKGPRMKPSSFLSFFTFRFA